MTRIYHPETLKNCDTQEEVSLTSEASHHLCTVLRMQEGETVRLFSGDGNDYEGILSYAHKKNARVRIQKCYHNATESPFQMHLLQGICRGEKMDWIIQKAVELGVTEITPVITERTQGNKSLKDAELLAKKNQHYQQIIISACEQSGRARIPILHPALSLEALLKIQKNSISAEPEGRHTSKIILSPELPNHPSIRLSQIHPAQCLTFMVGPEGGFTDQELLSAIDSEFSPVTLGPRILRTETAAIAFISAIQAKFGDFQ